MRPYKFTVKTYEVTDPRLNGNITITVECEEEHAPYVGNCMASGVESVDKEMEDWIRKELFNGNMYAWSVAVVTAELEGESGFATLCGMSYRNEETWLEGISDHCMQSEAIDDLIKSIKASIMNGESAKLLLNKGKM